MEQRVSLREVSQLQEAALDRLLSPRCPLKGRALQVASKRYGVQAAKLALQPVRGRVRRARMPAPALSTPAAQPRFPAPHAQI